MLCPHRWGHDAPEQYHMENRITTRDTKSQARATRADRRAQQGRPSYANLNEAERRDELTTRGVAARKVRKIKLADSLSKALEELDDTRDGIRMKAKGWDVVSYADMKVRDLRASFTARLVPRSHRH